MSDYELPVGFRWERLRRDHPRRHFKCGEPEVDRWLRTKAWQHQKLDSEDLIAGYYTLAMGQVDFSDLPNSTVSDLSFVDVQWSQ